MPMERSGKQAPVTAIAALAVLFSLCTATPTFADAGKPAQAAVEPIGKGERIFIAGHSFNVFVCKPLEALAKEAGLAGHTTYGVQFIGNSTPMQHWNQGTDETNIAKAALRTGKLDVFTMSPNATMPEDGIDKFADLAQQTNPSIRLLVQQSWAAWDGNTPNMSSFPRGAGAPPTGRAGVPAVAATAPAAPQFPQGCPERTSLRRPAGATAPNQGAQPARPANTTAGAGFVNADRDKTTAADIAAGRERGRDYVNRMRAQLQAINTRHQRQMAYLVPAGEAVGRLREQVIAGNVPGVAKQSELFADAMGHAGPTVNDLVSYVWFATLYRRNPVGMTALDAERTEASAARHRLLQQIAWQTVLDEPMSGVK